MYDLQPLESDVILTFSQIIQDLEAQCGRDLSRYLAMNELYDRANGLRPRLALSLDDTDKKESGYSIYISFYVGRLNILPETYENSFRQSNFTTNS